LVSIIYKVKILTLTIPKVEGEKKKSVKIRTYALRLIVESGCKGFAYSHPTPLYPCTLAQTLDFLSPELVLKINVAESVVVKVKAQIGEK
jgi:hypothetical protein